MDSSWRRIRMRPNTSMRVEGAGAENRDWMTPDPFRVWGPYDHITAVIINGRDKRDATVSILKGNVCIKTYHLNSMTDVIMVFLDPGFYCICKASRELFFLCALAAYPTHLGALDSEDYLKVLIKWWNNVDHPKGLTDALEKHSGVLPKENKQYISYCLPMNGC